VRERRRLAGILDMDPLELEKLLSPVEAVYAALDHTKGMAFILSEGVVPSNVREGYLARLLFRRSFRLLRKSGIEDKLPDLVEAQIAQWGPNFDQLREMRDEIMEMVAVEDEKYRETLRRGKSLVGRYLKQNKDAIPVEKIVEFYDSHGLTPEDVKEAAAEAATKINVPDNFYSLVAQRHMKPVTPREEAEEKELVGKVEGLEKTSLLFYRDPYLREFDAEVIDVIDDKYIVLDRTAFYAEGGGQVSDIGKLIGKTQSNVVDVQTVEDVLLHETEKADNFRKGDKVRGVIDWERRSALMRSHTATHLLLGAAKRVLGDHAWQAGAQKGVEHSRLDISHYNRLTRGEIEAIEQLANQVVTEGRHVACRWMQRNEAEARYGFRLYQGGAVPGKEIRIVEVEGGWDAEACGGTHLKNTSETGLVKIINVERVQDGVERLVFATGPQAIKEIQKRDRILMELSEVLESPQEKVRETASNIIETMKKLRHERDDYLILASIKISQDLLSAAHHLNGLELVVTSKDKSPDFLIEVGNTLVELETKTVALMRSTLEPRFIVKTGKDAIARGIHAGKLAQEISKNIGGGGGGEPHFGQGGGFDERKADTYFSEKNIEKIKKMVEEMSEHPQ
jgi:alanyl-tRNA synthetase